MVVVIKILKRKAKVRKEFVYNGKKLKKFYFNFLWKEVEHNNFKTSINVVPSKLSLIATTPGFYHIAKYIFAHLDIQTLLNCRKVNSALKSFLENPHFWLQKSLAWTMPPELEMGWKSLIDRCPINLTKYLIKTITGVPQEKHYFFKGRFQSPINLACKYGEIAILETLQAHGGLQFDNGYADLEIQKILIREKSEWDTIFTNKDEYILPLQIAAENGHTQIVKFLSSQDMWPCAINILGGSAFHYASAGNHFEVVEFLLGQISHYIGHPKTILIAIQLNPK